MVNNTMNIILSCLFNYMFVSFFTKTAFKCDFLCASKIMVEYFDRALSLRNVELLYLKTQRRLSTPRTTVISQEDRSVVKCSMELYRCLEKLCSISKDVKSKMYNSSSFSWSITTKMFNQPCYISRISRINCLKKQFKIK